jgi:hypothetical protein
MHGIRVGVGVAGMGVFVGVGVELGKLIIASVMLGDETMALTTIKGVGVPSATMDVGVALLGLSDTCPQASKRINRRQ